MLFYCGVGLIVLTPIGLGLLAFLRRLEGLGTAMGIGIVGILAGVILSVLPSIHHVIVNLGGGKSVDIPDIQEVATAVENRASEIKTEAAEVKTLKDQTAKLAQQVQKAEQQIAQTEANMSLMQQATKQAMREFIEMYFIDVSTRNLIGIPRQEILDEMNPRLTALEQFAYESPQQERAAFAHMHEVINKVEAPFVPKATPTATATAPH